jgi:hypothetical protein
MAAGYQDIFLEKGTTFTTQLSLKDTGNVPYNLVGFTIVGKAKRSYYSSSVALTFDTSIYDAANGVIQLAASANSTANLIPGKLVYDVNITQNTSGVVTRVLEGQIFVSPTTI